MGIMSWLFGDKDKMKQQSTMTGGQNQFLEQLLNQLGMMGGQGGGMGNSMSLMQQYLDPNSDVYKTFEQPYLDQFNQQTIPGIAERFAGLGGGLGGGLSSSGFGQSLGAAGGNLQNMLAQLKGQMQQQAAGNMFGQYNQMANQALGSRPFENVYQPGSTGVFGGLLSGLGSGVGTGAGMGLGNYMGNRFLGNQNNSVLGRPNSFAGY